MNGAEQILKVGAKVLVVGWCVVVVKLYSELRYHQGWIDAKTDSIEQLKAVTKDFNKSMNTEEEA